MNLYVVHLFKSTNPFPYFVGPLTAEEAYDLGERLNAANIPWESGPLLTEAELLPGLWTHQDSSTT